MSAGASTATESTRRRRSSIKDAIDEKLLAYEREPVPRDSLKGWLSFWGIFISRHTAGTEFAIGPLFVANGATAIDVVVGLLIGNILATLSWRFLVAPLATSQRLTAYYAMELVVGKHLMLVYDILACVLLAGLAGAMFTVSATAFGAISDVPMPELDDWLPSSWAFVGIVIGCGLVTTVVAAFGFTYVATFGELMTPVLIAGIIYLCVQSLQMLGINDECGFWCIMTEKVYADEKVDPNLPTFGFGRCLAFAWFVDLQLHIGQNDLSLLRFAKSPNIGWASAGGKSAVRKSLLHHSCGIMQLKPIYIRVNALPDHQTILGMFIGHYFAWIVAGLMYAVQLQETGETSVAPGPIANLVGGGFGICIIVIAGWSTANPVLYSSGLALQHMFPQIRAWLSTIIVGILATVAACFPGLTNKIMEVSGSKQESPFPLFLSVHFLPAVQLTAHTYASYS